MGVPKRYTDNRLRSPISAGLPYRMRAGIALWPLLATVAFVSCRPGIRAPEFEFRSVSVGSAQETVVALAIFNPNRFPLRVQSVDYEVLVGEQPCGRGRRDEPLFLDARDTTEAEFGLSPDWCGVAVAIPALLSDSVELGVKGSYTVATVFGRRRFGFEGRRMVSVKDDVSSYLEQLFSE